MGFLSRMLVPRSVRRAAHPVRSAKRAARKAVVPKSVRKATYTASQLSNPVGAAWYHGVERPLNTKKRKSSGPVFHHGACTINHRSYEAAQKCRKG